MTVVFRASGKPTQIQVQRPRGTRRQRDERLTLCSGAWEKIINSIRNRHTANGTINLFFITLLSYRLILDSI